ncbi:hypothetical protein glysoja_000606 [Glycine soja]|nr:hypothetical protein glysoja_000606 [Glycine soja]
MMHSVKGGWGQTFALAKHNESEGRKTRIRRSKQERKAMVESFIKKYQESNNGNFPSLNLTHKEVGGSFYTVREIVRDVIQENRVLGPAKFTLEELNTDQFFEQNPLGSIARDPQPFLAASLIENHCELDKLQDTNSKMISVSDVSYTEAVHQQVVDKGDVISVGHVDVTNKESIEAAVVVDGCDTGDEHPMFDKGQTMNVSQVDVTNNESVETAVFSGGCCSGTEHKIVDRGHVLNGSQVNMINEESNETVIPEMQVGDPLALNQNVEQELAVATTPMAKITAVTEDLDSSNAGLDKEENVQDMLEESSNHSTRKELFDHHEFEDRSDSQVRAYNQNIITFKTISQSQMIDGVKTSTQTNNLSKTCKPSEEDGSLLKADKHRVDDQLGGNSQRRSNTTVDRINLESWDGAAKNSAKQEPNPLLAVLKVFVDAFVKFWSG